MYTKLASAIYNDIYAGLGGFHTGNSLSIELLEDEIVNTRLAVIKEYLMKGVLPLQDLLVAINCLETDCQDLERCCANTLFSTPTMHFQIPQLINDYGSDVIAYLGTTDRMNAYTVYIGAGYLNNYNAYRKRNRDKPYVYIDPAPNKDGFLDCWVFNAPFVKQLSIVAAFKDLRLLEGVSCCELPENLGWNSLIDNEVKSRITKEKIYYYRQLAAPVLPNDLSYK